MDPSVGELAVSHELDVLNHRFQALLNMLVDQLKNLALVNTDDLELQVSNTFVFIYINIFLEYSILYYDYPSSEKKKKSRLNLRNVDSQLLFLFY